jgi:hypothetical protein
MRTISRTIPGAFVLFLALCLASGLQAQAQTSDAAQTFPADMVQISPADASALLSVGRLFRISSYPNDPPLPPVVLFLILGMQPDGSRSSDSSGSATNYAVYFSASVQAIFLDDRTAVAETMLAQAAMNGNRMMSQDDDQDQQDDSDSPTLDTTQLYLQITNVDTAQAYLNLYNATNQVYAIWSTTNLAGSWNVETEVWPTTNQEVMPFTVPTLGRDNLFLLAEDWTGVTENNNTTPDWRFWQYFGTVALSDTNLDSQGNTLLYDYTNRLDPNIITFTVSATNTYVNQTTLPVQISLLAGTPNYYSVLVNDTNPADANWLPYAGPNLTVSLGSTDGVYAVSVGLRGLPPSATQTWQTLTIFRDTTPLTLALTNLAALSGSRPFVDPAGYTTRSLSALTWTVLDANGATNTGNGMVVAQAASFGDPYHRTNWFQCVDLALALGTNWISIQAVDWAGTVAVTNFAYVFDTNGDTTAPALTLVWPQDGTQVSGDTFTVQAWIDDDTATVTLQYTDTNGIVQTVSGLVERGGNVWVPGVPLAAGTNSLSLLATDAAGNVSTNSFSVVQSSVGLTVNPLQQDQMQYAYATVTGMVDDPDCTVTVNGVPTTDYCEGYWEVDNVPLQPGGTVALQATAQLAGGATLQTLLKQERGPIVFTQTYRYTLDYTMLDWTLVSTNGSETVHNDFQWARGVGGTNTLIHSSVDSDTGVLTSSCTVTVWPPDSGYLPMLHGQRVISDYTDGQLTSSYTTTVDAPAVQWMEDSKSSGTWQENFDVGWAEGSGREIRLFTGGDAVRHRQGLFDLSASLNFETCLNPDVPDWCLYSVGNFLSPEQPPVAVPFQQINLGGLGNLGSDGHLWTLQPDGQEVIVTDHAPTESYEGSLPNQQKYSLRIFSGAQDVTDTNVNALVGQRIVLTCQLMPDGGPPITNFQWTVPGTPLTNFYVSPDPLQTNGYAVPLTQTNTNTVRFCWVYSGAKSVTCKVKADGQEWPAQTTFSVKRPKATLTATIQAQVEVHNNKLRFGDNYIAGITFMSRDEDTSGDWQYIQVGHELNRFQDGETGNWFRGEGSGLDTAYPYPYDRDYPSTELPAGGSVTTAAGTFTTYLAFRLTPSDVLVPIRQISWNWEGYASTNGSGLWTGYGTAYVDPQDSPAPSIISWTNNIITTLTNVVPEN